MITIKELESEIDRCDKSGHNEDYRDCCYAKLEALKDVLKLIDEEPDEDEESIIEFKRIIKQKIKGETK